jgi:large subunit ribosomal protein L19
MEEEKKEKEGATVHENDDQETEESPRADETKAVTAAEEAESSVTGTGEIGDLNFYSEVRTDLPEIKPGNVVRVFYRVIEGGKERIQVFEGTVIAIKNRGIAKTVTVRKTSFGIAVERIFPLNSRLIQKIEIKKRQKVRQAKLYYLRNLKGKAARLKELR